MDSAVSGLFGAILGAIIGGIFTYLAATKQYKFEHQTKQRAALLAVMLEICRQQDRLVLELDRVLPLWLVRKNVRDTFLEKRLRLYTDPLATYSTKVFDHFFHELIPSRYGPEIDNYYRNLNNLNYLAKKYTSQLERRNFVEYIMSLSNAIGLANDIVIELSRYCQREINQQWGRDADLNGFFEYSDKYQALSEISKTSLKDINEYLSGRGTPTSISPKLRNDKPSLLYFKRFAEGELSTRRDLENQE